MGNIYQIFGKFYLTINDPLPVYQAMSKILIMKT